MTLTRVRERNSAKTSSEPAQGAYGAPEEARGTVKTNYHIALTFNAAHCGHRYHPDPRALIRENLPAPLKVQEPVARYVARITRRRSDRATNTEIHQIGEVDDRVVRVPRRQRRVVGEHALVTRRIQATKLS